MARIHPYGYSCVICGKGFCGKYSGKNTGKTMECITTKRNTVLYFHKECYEEEAKRSRLNAAK